MAADAAAAARGVAMGFGRKGCPNRGFPKKSRRRENLEDHKEFGLVEKANIQKIDIYLTCYYFQESNNDAPLYFLIKGDDVMKEEEIIYFQKSSRQNSTQIAADMLRERNQ